MGATEYMQATMAQQKQEIESLSAALVEKDQVIDGLNRKVTGLQTLLQQGTDIRIEKDQVIDALTAHVVVLHAAIEHIRGMPDNEDIDFDFILASSPAGSLASIQAAEWDKGAENLEGFATDFIETKQRYFAKLTVALRVEERVEVFRQRAKELRDES